MANRLSGRPRLRPRRPAQRRFHPLTGPGARLIALLASFLIDAGVLALLIRVCGVRAPRGDLLQGAGLGALAFGILRQTGTGAVGAAARGNPMLAPFTAMIVLILWLHLACRVVLYTCAWTANPLPWRHPSRT